MFVLGCHRSGTSLLASILSEAAALHGGSSISAGSHQLEPQVDNPGGFFETRQLVAFNECLLGLVGIDWQRPPLHPIHWQDPQLFPRLFDSRSAFAGRATTVNWIDKDPRLCLTYPAYLHVFLRRVPIVAIVRHPFEVACSLQARDNLPFAKGLLIWFLYNQHLSYSLRFHEDQLVSYDSLMVADHKAADRLASFLGGHLRSEHSLDQLSQVIAAQVNQDWRRQSDAFPESLLPQQEWRLLADECLERYQALVSADFTIECFRSAFASTPAAILCAYSVQGSQCPSTDRGALDADLAALQDQLRALRRSTSWRLTAPLRWCVDGLKTSRPRVR